MLFCGDWDSWIRVCSTGRVVFVSDELNFFRCHASTSRAVGYIPSAAAEFFACRLLACIGIAAPSLSGIDLIQGFLDPRKRWQWNHVIRSLSFGYFSEARSRYYELPNFPVLSNNAWLILQILLFWIAFIRRIPLLSSKLIRQSAIIYDDL
jgi:hypothetical protein